MILGIGMTQKSAFLDTNALVNLFCYWEACDLAGIALNGVADWNALKAALVGANIPALILTRDDAQSVRAGHRWFNNLESNLGRYQYYSSSICRSEMHHVLLESLAMDRLVSQRVPRGLRFRRPQVLHRRVLQSSDYQSISGDIDAFFDSLRQDHGIHIVDVEDFTSGSGIPIDDIWNTAREVWSRVLIDVMDSYIYAAAVELQADTFLTSDGSLYEALDNLSNPAGDWIQLVSSLKTALGIPQNRTFPIPKTPGQSL